MAMKYRSVQPDVPPPRARWHGIAGRFSGVIYRLGIDDGRSWDLAGRTILRFYRILNYQDDGLGSYQVIKHHLALDADKLELSRIFRSMIDLS
jgi:hypothetical protein